MAESSLGPSHPLDQVVLDRVVLGQVVPWTGLSAGLSCPLGRVVWLPSLSWSEQAGDLKIYAGALVSLIVRPPRSLVASHISCVLNVLDQQ